MSTSLVWENVENCQGHTLQNPATTQSPDFGPIHYLLPSQEFNVTVTDVLIDLPFRHTRSVRTPMLPQIFQRIKPIA